MSQRFLFSITLVVTHWILLVFLLSLALGGCTSLQPGKQIAEPFEPQGAPTNPFAGTAEVIGTQSLPDMSTQEPEKDPSLPIPAVTNPQTLIETAKEDLARRLSISVAQIDLGEINQVFWPDSSLGCPQASKTYTQTEIPGYLFRLEYDGDEF
jgi:hypothetical protein